MGTQVDAKVVTVGNNLHIDRAIDPQRQDHPDGYSIADQAPRTRERPHGQGLRPQFIRFQSRFSVETSVP